jgi:hypothetical protein
MSRAVHYAARQLLSNDMPFIDANGAGVSDGTTAAHALMSASRASTAASKMLSSPAAAEGAVDAARRATQDVYGATRASTPL